MTKVEGHKEEVANEPFNPPAVEEVEKEESPQEELLHKEVATEKTPSNVGSNESFQFVSGGGSVFCMLYI